RRQKTANVVEILCGQAELLEMVAALRAASRFAGHLHRRQQQRDEDADDRDHHEQLHQGKSRASETVRIVHSTCSQMKDRPPRGHGASTVAARTTALRADSNPISPSI